MKTYTSALHAVIAVLLAFATAPESLAVAGVGDTTVIVGDVTDTWKWPRELHQWQTMISKTTEQIEKADEMIRLLGDPQQVVQQLMDSVPDLMKPVEDVIGLETRQHALRFANSLYHLKSVAVQTYKDANAVDDHYRAFGKQVKRDQKRYAHFVLQEAMNARYKKAVENAEAAEKHEAEVQRKALGALHRASTEAEIAVCHGLMAASAQRLALAHAKAEQAKAELDAFRGQLGVEEQRKAEANREWAHAVVARMRERALSSYQAQMSRTAPSE